MIRKAKLRESLKKLKCTGLNVSTVIDVGIQHSTPILIDLFAEIPHVLFEPVEEYYPHIRKNYRNLSYNLVEAAVSDTNGETILNTLKKTRGDEISHSYISKNKTSDSRTVKVLTLDNFFFESSFISPYLLKIDVEGPDVPSAIIRGSKKILENTALVIIEMTVNKLVERAKLLHDEGFDVWDICDLRYYDDCLWQADFIFIKRSIKNSNINLRPMHIKPFRSELWQKGFE